MSSKREENNERFIKSFRRYITKIIYEVTRSNNDDNNEDKTKQVLSDLQSEDKINYTSKAIAIEEFNTMIQDLKHIELDLLPYSKVTNQMFNEVKQDKASGLHFQTIEYSLKKNWEEFRDTNNDFEDVERCFLKLKEHVSLSIIQHTHISNSLSEEITTLNQKLNESKKLISEYTSQIDGLEQRLETGTNKIEEKLSTTYNNIITQFIAILGIFTAILVGTFSSLQGFSNLFEHSNDLPLGKLIFVTSLGSATVIFVLFFLFYTLAKIIDKNISSCSCYREKIKTGTKGLWDVFRNIGIKGTEDKYCECSIFERYTIFVIINYILFLIALSGIALMILGSNPDYHSLLQTTWGPAASICILFGIGILVLVWFHNKYIIKKRKYS